MACARTERLWVRTRAARAAQELPRDAAGCETLLLKREFITLTAAVAALL
jgi:hypothetical protein